MRNLLLTALLLTALLPRAAAQDTAEAVVERYLRLLNYEALPQDSMLVLETTITYHGQPDTFAMKRYYQHGGMMRVEVRLHGQLTNGLCTNGGSRHRIMSPSLGWWSDAEHVDFHTRMQGYDFRGPLYGWRATGTQLSYNGTTTLNGETLQVVRAEQKGHYVRYYMFEEQSGLLVVVLEKDELPAGEQKPMFSVKPIDFKSIHEYLPVGESLIPSQESFMRDGQLTIMETKAHFEPRNDMLFNRD